MTPNPDKRCLVAGCGRRRGTDPQFCEMHRTRLMRRAGRPGCPRHRGFVYIDGCPERWYRDLARIVGMGPCERHSLPQAPEVGR